MKKHKQFAALLLALLMLAMLAACGGTPASGGSTASGTAPPSQGQASTPAPEDEEPLEIVQWIYAPISAPESVLQTAIEEHFNVKLVNIESHDTLVLNIASGDYPDIAGTYPDEQAEWARQGLLREIPEAMIREYAPMYADVYDTYDPNAWKRCEINGVNNGLTCVYYEFGLPHVGVLRQDWLDAVGESDVPAEIALDKLEEIFLKFVNDDPDGNGQKDTAAFTFNEQDGSAARSMQINQIMGAFGVQVDKFVDVDGQAVYAPTMDEYRQALELLAGWYTLGIIDKEFATDSDAIAAAKFAEGKTGFAAGSATHLNPNLGMATFTPLLNWKALDPDAEWSYITKVTGPEGHAYSGGSDASLGWNLVFFEHVDDAKAQRILQYFNAQHESVENFKLVAFGIEGLHYHMNEELGTVDRTDEEWAVITAESTNGELTVGQGQFPIRTPMFGSLIYGSFIDEFTALPLADKRHINWVPGWPSEAMQAATDLPTVVAEYTVNAIMGKSNLTSDWDAFQQRLKDIGIEQITADFDEGYQSIK